MGTVAVATVLAGIPGSVCFTQVFGARYRAQTKTKGAEEDLDALTEH